MSKQYIGMICSVCNIPLTENDTAIFCDQCGMPYHEGCWQSNQGCATDGCPNNWRQISTAYIPPSQMPKAVPIPRTEEPAGPSKGRKKPTGRRVCVIIGSVVLTAALTCGVVFYGIPYFNYQSACNALNNGEYDRASQMFTDLGGFMDSEELAKAALYRKGKAALNAGQYDEAHQIFSGLDYKDSATMVLESQYQKAVDAMENGAYDFALQIFGSLGEYSDSKQLISESYYRKANHAMENGEYEIAAQILWYISDYKDSSQLLQEAKYQRACAMLHDGYYDEAGVIFEEIGSYKDSWDMIREAKYLKGNAQLNQGEYELAVDTFNEIIGYKDSIYMIKEAKYQYVMAYTHCNNDNLTTFEYLCELKSEGYKNAATIYKDLYDWKIKIVAWNSDKDSKANQSSISKYDPVFCHFKLSGGTPNDEVRIYVSGIRPNGTAFSDTFDDTWDDGSTCWYKWYYLYPEYGDTGTLILYFYDDSNNIIGTGSVEITD